VRCQRYAPAVVDNIGYAVRRNASRFGESILRKAICGQKFLLQHFAGRDWCKLIPRHLALQSMIVHDSHFVRFALDPFEDDAPLIVDANRIEVLQISLELFQSVY
jgi:hypothetical protein